LTNSWLSIDEWWSANETVTVDREVYRTHRHASVSFCLSQPAWMTTMKRSVLIHSGKSEAEVTRTEDCALRILLLKLTADEHKASRGLSATCSSIFMKLGTQDLCANTQENWNRFLKV